MSGLASASLDVRERRVVQRFVELLRAELGDDLRAVWLYGSRARGETPHEDSDIDLLVITRGGRARDLASVTRLLARGAGTLGAEPSSFAAHVMDPELLEQRRRIGSFFIREVDRDKIVLYRTP